MKNYKNNSAFDCTIIILSYNSRSVTDTCLKKLKKAVSYCENRLQNQLKVIVVENGSSDGSTAMIRKNHSWLKLIALNKNLGYPVGNNLAMKQSNTPYILLMNSDTYVKKDSLFKMLVRMLQGDCDLLVSRLRQDDRTFRDAGGHLPTPIKVMQWTLGLESFPIINRFLHRIYTLNSSFYAKEGQMEWYPLVFTLLRREVYSKTRGFDEKMWFHMVDFEWFHRIKQLGFVLRYTPSVEVVHIGGASSEGLSETLTRDNFEGLLYFCNKHYPDNINLISFFIKFGLEIRSFAYFLFGRRTLSTMYRSISQELVVR